MQYYLYKYTFPFFVYYLCYEIFRMAIHVVSHHGNYVHLNHTSIRISCQDFIQILDDKYSLRPIIPHYRALLPV